MDNKEIKEKLDDIYVDIAKILDTGPELNDKIREDLEEAIMSIDTALNEFEEVK